jgi:hypothetical protein
LSAGSRKLWQTFTTTWALNPEGQEVLRLGLLARDRMELAAATLTREGLTIATRGGGQRAHPAARIHQQERGAWLAALRQLGLEG